MTPSAESAVTTVGGIALGASLGAVVAPEQPVFVRVIAVLIAAAGSYSLLAPSVGWWFPGRQIDLRRQVATDARTLLGEVAQLAADTHQPFDDLRSQLHDHLTEAGSTILWHWQNRQRSDPELKEYDRRLRGKAESVYRRATALGYQPGPDVSVRAISHPGNPLGLREVPTILGDIADQMENR